MNEAESCGLGVRLNSKLFKKTNQNQLKMYQPRQSLMPINPVFNPNGNDNTANRLIWFGETTNLMQLNDVRYSWAVSLYRQMRENFWIN